MTATVTGTCLIALNKGLHTWVDVEDLAPLCGTLWHATEIRFSRRQAHYAAGRVGHHTVGLHRYVTACRVSGIVVDHINHDGLDNRQCNLRWLTQSQNVKNRSHGLDAPLSLCILPPGVPVISREQLRSANRDDLRGLLADAPLSPLRLAA